ncbi:MAG: pseudoazurin [Pseudomonadales bacterium]|jgi:pseudoazurin
MKQSYKIFMAIGFSLAAGLAFTAEHNVKMLNNGSDGFMVFEPAVLSVEVGDTVTFVATDMSHNSASIEGMIPEGAATWSGLNSTDISVTFDKAGVYAYECTPHAMMAMVGVINVGQSKANLAAVKAAATSKKTSFVTNKDRLDGYLAQL